jgi:hypothetical protein
MPEKKKKKYIKQKFMDNSDAKLILKQIRFVRSEILRGSEHF